MQFSLKFTAIILVSFFTVKTAISTAAETLSTSTSEQIMARGEQGNNPSRKRLRHTKQESIRAPLSSYNRAFQTGLGVAHACGYSRGNNTSACATLNSSISILSNGCSKGDRNACQWTRQLYDLEATARASSYIQSL
jgi:hypothetical protein